MRLKETYQQLVQEIQFHFQSCFSMFCYRQSLRFINLSTVHQNSLFIYLFCTLNTCRRNSACSMHHQGLRKGDLVLKRGTRVNKGTQEDVKGPRNCQKCVKKLYTLICRRNANRGHVIVSKPQPITIEITLWNPCVYR